ncbi:MAG: restriction endonuclease subunit S [Lachnospiraceae bacterium]|nr:restriction endonuclease subunit S [Lachnospiraceae bacterium]
MGESLSFLKDGTHGTHADADDGPLLLSAKNIKDGTIKWDETDRRISQEEYEKIHSNFALKTGDVLLTIVGSIGETAILKKSEGLTFQRSVAFLRPKEDILSEFLYTEIQTLTFQKELESRKSTSAQPGIYLGDLAEIPVKYSPSLDEQNKIGEYFLNIDNLITLQQRKYFKIIPKRKSIDFIVYNNFFTNEWEQRKLGEIARNVLGGGTPKTNVGEYWDGNIPWIQSSNVQEDEMFDFNIPKRITELGLNKSATKLVPQNSIAVVTHVGVGKLVFVPFAYTTSQDFTSLADLETDPIFTCYSLYKRLQDDLHIVQGSAIKGITKDDLLAKEIMVPEQDEQCKIGEYFRSLDNLITLQQCESHFKNRRPINIC